TTRPPQASSTAWERATPMTDHTKTDGLPGMPAGDEVLAPPQVLERSRPRSERMASDKIECNACPVLCQISPGRTGACDRYANQGGVLVRVDPVLMLRRTLEAPAAAVVAFADRPALAAPGAGEAAEPA